ncbi:glycosyltransferase family 2 protein [Rhodopirellula sp. MGV]|uniref:glycosyltransferase family 2 protein n=1 Tax=Rhodopirellula sp. MGV TaxID=2023130 RepID=UPI000B9612A8|nr:glycosyltransferase family 2 protein [Rhodopirellula sp. MGV]OYP33016.1 hypothetical protein CGZ80_19195 [Rhodopirellula sp. MGV]PNY35322.1 glycosyltransferase family 2 protein [Rhodopirellula baltica]
MTEYSMMVVFWIATCALLYALFGYPIVLVVFARLSKRRAENDFDELPRVTLIVPAHNEIKVIRQKLENIRGIDYPADRLEILIGSDGSTDGTNEFVQANLPAGAKLIPFQQRRGKASVVNDCVAASTADIVCLCDANVMFRPDALKRLVHRLADETVGAATGQVILRSEESDFGSGEATYYDLERQVQLAESSVGSLIGVDGGMYVIWRSLYQPLPADTILDDFVISMRVMRAKKRVVYEPDAIADENGTPLATQEWRRRVRVSAGAAQSLLRGDFPLLSTPVFFWQYLSHKLLRWMIPVFLIALYVSNLFLVSEHWFYTFSLAAQTSIYVIALLATWSLRFRSTRLGGVPFYFTMSNLAMLVGISKGIFNLQPVTWVQADRSVQNA